MLFCGKVVGKVGWESSMIGYVNVEFLYRRLLLGVLIGNWDGIVLLVVRILILI